MSLIELKNLIRETPISTIVGKYVTLRKAGANYIGLCPFHSDKHPSLTVNDQKGMFKCFACDVGGNAISFVQKYNQLDYHQALRELANLLGYQAEIFNRENSELKAKRELAHRVLELAAKLYYKLGQSGRYPEYTQFLKERGISESSALKFSVGIAPSGDHLIQYLETLAEHTKGEAIAMAVEIGVLRQKEEGDFCDMFNDRIIFPIWDQYGRVSGLGSRAIHAYQKAKYINSRESFVFNKKNLLYGFNFAKNILKEKESVLIVEGYMDLLSLHQYSFENSVAVMGVALSQKQIQNLKAFAKNIYLCLDADEAGYKATQRMSRSLLEQGVMPYFIDLSPHKDPDEFLKNEGSLKFSERLESAKIFLDVEIERTLPPPGEVPEMTDRKLEILERIFDLVSPLKEGLSATERIIDCAKKLGLSSGAAQILETYREYLNRNGAKYQQKKDEIVVHAKIEIEELPEENKQQIEVKEVKPLGLEVKYLVRELVCHPECLKLPELQSVLALFDDPEIEQFVSWLQQIYFEVEETEYISLVMEKLLYFRHSQELRDFIGNTLYNYHYFRLEKKKCVQLLFDLRRQIQQEQLKRKRDLLREKQKECISEEEGTEIMGRIILVEREMRKIKEESICRHQY